MGKHLMIYFSLVFEHADRWIRSERLGVAVRVNELFALIAINARKGDWKLE